MNNRAKAHISVFLANLIYGVNFSIARVAMPHYISPSAFIVLRVLFTTALFFILDFRVSGRKRIERSDYFQFFLLGLFGVATNQLLFFEGLVRTSNINAALIMTSTPILVLLIAYILLKEQLQKKQITGIICGLSGAVLLILQYRNVQGRSNAAGDLMILLNATSYALYLVRTKPMMKKYDTWQVVKWTFLFGSIIVIPFGAAGLSEVQWAMLPMQVWLSIGFVLLFTTFFAYFLNTFGLQHLSAGIVSFYIYLQPLFATLISVWITHEAITYIQITACLLIFAGVYLVNRPSLVKVKS